MANGAIHVCRRLPSRADEETSARVDIEARRPGYPPPSSEAVSSVMRGNRKTGSRPEAGVCVASFTEGASGIARIQPLRTNAGVVRPDLAFPGPKVAVFVDGCFWHSCPLHGNTPGTNRDYWEPKLRGNRERDGSVTEALVAEGWVVVRVWEHDPWPVQPRRWRQP